MVTHAVYTNPKILKREINNGQKKWCKAVAFGMWSGCIFSKIPKPQTSLTWKLVYETWKEWALIWTHIHNHKNFKLVWCLCSHNQAFSRVIEKFLYERFLQFEGSLFYVLRKYVWNTRPTGKRRLQEPLARFIVLESYLGKNIVWNIWSVEGMVVLCGSLNDFDLIHVNSALCCIE